MKNSRSTCANKETNDIRNESTEDDQQNWKGRESQHANEKTQN